VIDQDLLDQLWDFADPAGTEARFRLELTEGPYDDAERNELKTQLARSLGLQERFAEAWEVLASIDVEDDALVDTRVALEAGRLRNSAGEAVAAIGDFRAALAFAEAADAEFLMIDAVHMLAIADAAGADVWAEMGIERASASADQRTRRWLVSLTNNRGWQAFDAGEYDRALADFTSSLENAERYGTEQQRQWAREAIDECRAAIIDSAPPVVD